MKALAFGEVLWDVYPDERYLGGAPLNFSAHLSRFGAQVYLVSAVGVDELGDAALKQIRDWGVRCDYIDRLAHRETGKCLVTLREGMPSYRLLENAAWDTISAGEIRGQTFDALYFGTLALRSRENRQQLQYLMDNNRIKERFVDLNLRPPFCDRETVNWALERASIVKISDEELPEVLELLGESKALDAESAAKSIARRFPQLDAVILTLAEKGSCAYAVKEDKFFRVDAVKTKLVSSVGAGDSFCAAWLYGYFSGKKWEECLRVGAALAAFVVSRPEAVPEYRIEEGEKWNV